jgi:DNA-binding protein YbaB
MESFGAAELEDAMRDIMAEYEKARQDLATAQQQLAGISGKARSKNRMLSVTVDGHGNVSEVKLHGARWRNMPPGELGELIVATIKDAREAAQKEKGAVLGPLMPDGQDLSGAIDWAAAFPDTPQLPAVIKDFLAGGPGK